MRTRKDIEVMWDGAAGPDSFIAKHFAGIVIDLLLDVRDLLKGVSMRSLGIERPVFITKKGVVDLDGVLSDEEFKVFGNTFGETARSNFGNQDDPVSLNKVRAAHGYSKVPGPTITATDGESHPDHGIGDSVEVMGEGIKSLLDVSPGDLYTTDGKDVWKVTSLSHQPTVQLQNVETRETHRGAVGGPFLSKFTPLVPKETK